MASKGKEKKQGEGYSLKDKKKKERNKETKKKERKKET